MRLVEIFLHVVINGNSTRYLISDAGRVFNLKSKKFMKTRISKGYERINLTVNGKNISKYVHVLVATAFIPNSDMKRTVNHIDGNKLNNDVDNLEWATYSEQAIHAIKTGLRTPLYAEQNPSTKYHSEDIHRVCKLLEENNLSIPEISNITCVSQYTIREIYHRHYWKSISNGYDFSKYDKLGATIIIYKDDEIHHVCKLLEENNLVVSDISIKTGVDSFSIRSIIRKKSWVHISDQYNIDLYDKIRPTSKYPIDKIHRVCKLLEENNLSIREISNITDIPYKHVHAILNKKNWVNISSKYNINYTAYEIKR